jgi:hypothetical protein
VSQFPLEQARHAGDAAPTSGATRLSRLVLEQFEQREYEQAIIHAVAVGKKNPHEPRLMNLALRDELKRLLGPN